MSITIENIAKEFEGFKALDGINVEIETGSLVALLGPSGSGKSTLLRVIAGLEKPDCGRIEIAERDVTGIPIKDRNIGFVFQNYALFKHMTVEENIGFALKIRNALKAKTKAKVKELLELVQLQGLGDRYPHELSGGQRQRVALARSLAIQPQVLLLDEPFGALDAKVRKDLRIWLRDFHRQIKVTTVLVTHDQEEAMEICDRIVVMNDGKLEQVGTPQEIYDHPKTPFVMGFIGAIQGLNELLSPTSVAIEEAIEIPGDEEVFVRPHDWMITTKPTEDAHYAEVSKLIYLGAEIQAELTLETQKTLEVILSREQFIHLNIRVNQQVYVKPQKIKSFKIQNPEGSHRVPSLSKR